MKHTLIAPESQRLKLGYEQMLSNVAVNFKLRHYSLLITGGRSMCQSGKCGQLYCCSEVGRCR